MSTRRTDYVMMGVLFDSDEVGSDDFSFDIVTTYERASDRFAFINHSPCSSSEYVFGAIISEADEFCGLNLTEIEPEQLSGFRTSKNGKDLIKTLNRLTGLDKTTEDINLYVFTRWS